MSRRLVVIAGAGALAPLVARAALDAGDAVRVVRLADIEVPAGADAVPGDLAAPESVIKAVREFGATHLVLAGAVSLDDATRVRLSGALGSSGQPAGGDSALSGLAGQLEQLTGARLVGAHEVVRNLLAPRGAIAGPEADAAALATAQIAVRAARAIGGLDLGQAAIAQGARVIAAEDAAGTDELIARVGEYRRRGLIGDTAILVLGKASKPGQQMQIDLPAVGPQTVLNAAAAGIGLIAVETGRTLVLDRPALEREAEISKISVVGLDVGD